jgi:hypothetical protein
MHTMRIINPLIGLLVIGGITIYLTGCKNKQNSSADNTHIQESDTSKNRKSADNPYNDLRQLAFNATPAQAQVSKSTDPNKVYGVIMDWDLGEGTATLVSFETGDASMYLSSGGGVIGGAGHDDVKKAVSNFISLAQTYLDKTSKTDTTLLPDKNCVKFYLLTSKGRFVAQEKMSNIENESSKWLSFFEEANKVISALRIVAEKK